jgi:hypothetical protein
VNLKGLWKGSRGWDITKGGLMFKGVIEWDRSEWDKGI